ncbi:MAG: FAD-binding oxidoreductase [Bdellovibrionales bacterium]|nr:FAD-binding oxidoreductase [Bdellovibrionales bacterium]
MELQSLTQTLGSEKIRTDKESFQNYGKDWTKHISANPSAIVFPTSTQDVVNIVQWARKNKVALVPSGGRTGLSGAAIATHGEVVVSFEKMNKILEFNEFDQTVRLEPGVITETLQNYAKEKGLLFPVDFASRGSSQIGGNIATNAGGINVIRYGLTRNWVSSLEVVTGEGKVLHLNNSLIKNASGYDLRHLFIGSEGTLGFITQAEVHLSRPTQNPTVFLFAVPELSGVMKIYHSFKKQIPLLAFEMFTDVAMGYVLKHTGLKPPLSEEAPYYVIVELENDSENTMETAMAIFESSMEQGWLTDGTISQSAQQAKDIWRLREDITEATSPWEPYKNDVSVRISKVPEFLTEVDQVLKTEYPAFETVWFGHIGDGNLHINILKPQNMTSAEFIENCHKVDEILFEKIERFGGSVSAEHGVGLTKKPYLHHTRSHEEIAYMKAIKAVFDPDFIMNPGKIFDESN